LSSKEGNVAFQLFIKSQNQGLQLNLKELMAYPLTHVLELLLRLWNSHNHASKLQDRQIIFICEDAAHLHQMTE